MLPYELSGEAFCPECRAKWDTDKVDEWNICGRAICECECMTRALKNSGALCHRKIVKYSLKTPVVHNTVMFIKKNNNARVYDFLASQLASVLLSDSSLEDILKGELVVTHVPRSRSAIVKYGHDQSAILAKALAKKLGAVSLPLLKRSRRIAVAQKKLSAKQRERNVRNMFVTVQKTHSFIEGKTILLVDDIVTTGSSMGACVSHLIRAGSKLVVCASVAATENSKRA